jgi:predicted GNAT superfamily acetyltransferase
MLHTTTAAHDAARAAAAAGVRIGLATDVAALRAVSEFFASIWQAPDGRPPLAADLLRSIVHAGGSVHFAQNGGAVAGACAAIFRPPAEKSVYSLIAAAGKSDRGVGFALKQGQRAWALECGATSMRWTFDPLVRRNARFNLVKLGAVAIEYAVDFYGPMDDGIDANDETDRLTVDWDLASPRAAARGPHHGEGLVGGGRSPESRPQAHDGPDLATVELDPRRAPDGGPLAASGEGGLWCRVPTDIVTLRRGDQQLAAAWRAAVRDVLEPAFAEGFQATGMSRDGWYHLTRRDHPLTQAPGTEAPSTQAPAEEAR